MKKWIAFWLIGVIGGSSNLYIHIAIEQTSPFQLVFTRTVLAAILLNVLLALRGEHMPLNRRQLQPMIVLGVLNHVVPFALITWGQQSVPSGIAAVLTATAALFTLVFAHFAFADERITRRRLIGLTTGFFGVVMLASRSGTGSSAQAANLVGIGAIVLAAAFYALGGTYGRGVVRGNMNPLVIAAGALTSAAVISGVLMLLAPMFGGQAMTPFTEIHGTALLSLVLLGIVNTGLAHLMYYWVLRELGAARTGMASYFAPLVGLTLGVLFLQEALDARMLLGALMILGGIAIVNLRFRRSPAIATRIALPDPVSPVN